MYGLKERLFSAFRERLSSRLPIVAVLSLMLAGPAAASETRFPQGSFTPSFSLGFGGSGSSKVFIVGGGVGYFVLDRLQVGPSYLLQWQSDAPSLQFFEGNVRFIVAEADSFAPYLKAKAGYVLSGSYDGVDFPDGWEVFAGPGVAIFLTENLMLNAEFRIGRYFFEESKTATFVGADEIQYGLGMELGVLLD